MHLRISRDYPSEVMQSIAVIGKMVFSIGDHTEFGNRAVPVYLLTSNAAARFCSKIYTELNSGVIDFARCTTGEDTVVFWASTSIFHRFYVIFCVWLYSP